MSGTDEFQFITRDHAIFCARNVAKKCGYALAVHGSLAKDVDLLAVPWIENTAYTAQRLAEKIADSLPGWFIEENSPIKQPHGRLSFAIRPRVPFGIDWWYIDLSVMPRRRKRPVATKGNPHA